MALLEIDHLYTFYQSKGGWNHAVDGVSLNLDRGGTVGIVGESGCGKTTLGRSIIQLLPPNGKIISGQIVFEGRDLCKLSSDQIRMIRWNKISMIFQNAMNSLNPVFKVGDVLTEVLHTHRKISRQQARDKIAQAFDLVGLPRSRIGSYPHQLSGGMKQRVVIAMSLLCDPDLIIADEPTTALDVIVQDQIVQKIKDLQKKLNIAMVLISHNISLVAETCERTAIMYAGKILEYADTLSIFKEPHHPYTIALMQSFPTVKGPLKNLASLTGSPPDLLAPPPGCRFAARCPLSEQICKKKEPPTFRITNSHYSCCHFALDPRLGQIEFAAA